jgi:hypothetical protein
MGELPDQRVIKLVRQVGQERQARLKVEHQARGLAAALSRTTDAKPKSTAS